MKGLLDKVAGVLKGLLDLNKDGRIQATEVMGTILRVAPVLSSPALALLRDHVGALADRGQVVDADGTPWTRDQAASAFDLMVAQADSLIARVDADSDYVRKVLAGGVAR